MTASRYIVPALALILLITGCTSSGGAPDPKDMQNTPDEVAAALADGISAADLTHVPLAGTDATAANEALETVTRGLDDATATVSVGSVTADDDTATAKLDFSWKLAGEADPWTYTSTAAIVADGDQWKAEWKPSLIQPDLRENTRLVQQRLPADRAEIVDTDGAPIVTEQDVWRVGLDKTAVPAADQRTSAVALAKLVGVDAKSYAAKVKGAGKQAFVEAIVFRDDDDTRPSEAELEKIKGAAALTGSQMLAPTREFARAILGGVGEASKEIIDESKGLVVAGDRVGVAGLQRRYDKQLRGTAGITVTVVPVEPSATASPSPSGAPSTPSEASPSATPDGPSVVYERKPVDGKPLTITLDTELQSDAEKILADVKPASSIVAIRPSTGEVVAAANGPGSDGMATANTGQYPPGSTFKVASSLALIRSGLKPSSTLTCPNTVTVDGKKFKNYSDYPSGSTGKIDLRTAVAQSCNTAFIGQRDRLKTGDLAKAAASLGVGTDYDVGFPAYFGQVPNDKTETGQAAAMIGQGKVLASPLAMAGVAASVTEGKTVLPTLVKGQQAKSKAEPLTAAEAKQLKEMMGAVVSDGSGRFLSDLDGGQVIAKTGTAEYGPKEPFDTHAWMIAAQGDLAVAVFVGEGESGSTTAGPLLKEFLEAAN